MCEVQACYNSGTLTIEGTGFSGPGTVVCKWIQDDDNSTTESCSIEKNGDFEKIFDVSKPLKGHCLIVIVTLEDDTEYSFKGFSDKLVQMIPLLQESPPNPQGSIGCGPEGCTPENHG